MCCVSCEVWTEFIYVMQKKVDLLCGLVVRVPGYRSRGPGSDSRYYQIFWVVVSLEQGPLILVSTTGELPGRKSSGSSLENQEYICRDPLCWPSDTLYPQKLALTSPTSCGRLVGIVRLQTKATEFVLFCSWIMQLAKVTKLIFIKKNTHEESVNSHIIILF
jgi:hypothetical protein